MLRVGIDVGGTHTDAVLLDGDEVVATTKASTSADVRTGVLEALEHVLAERPGCERDVVAVMLGTTQFTNAVVTRQALTEVAAVRIGRPSADGLYPKTGWPEDISRCLGDHVYAVHGGTLFDGHPLAPMDDAEIDRVIRDIERKGVGAVCVSAVFSPMNPVPERYLAERLARALPHVRVTMSHQIGSLGLIERENAALLNTALLDFADRVVSGFVGALRERGLESRLFISQNDGTLMDAEYARTNPALTFSSGPTNSLRGAAKLSGLEHAVVIDIGGTTSDIGVLQGGFPRTSNLAVDVGGVRTNFRMPDVLPVALGGGSVVSPSGETVGPTSLGHRLRQEGYVFGGATLTATDVMVAAGVAAIGDAAAVSGLDPERVRNARAAMAQTLEQGVQQVRSSKQALPAVLVGGGAFLAEQLPAGISSLERPRHAEVANAIGAAIAQVGGECERLMSYPEGGRAQALAEVTGQARAAAIAAGADPESLQVADVEETPMAYTVEPTARVRVKVVGDIAWSSRS